MINKTLKSIIVSLLLTLFISVPLIACASPIIDNADLMTRVTLNPDFKPDNAPGVIIGEDTLNAAGAESAFANYTLQMLAGGLITIAAPVAIIIIAIAGLIAVVSHGDQKLIDKAKKTLIWAIVGLVLIIFSWIIVRATISIVIEANPAESTTSSQSQEGDSKTQDGEAGPSSEKGAVESGPTAN